MLKNTTIASTSFSCNLSAGKVQISISDIYNSDIEKKVARLPAVTYVAGYCAHAALKKLMPHMQRKCGNG